jgi:hypothetical protein
MMTKNSHGKNLCLRAAANADFNTETHGDTQGKMIDNFKDYVDKFEDAKKADDGADTGYR